MEQSKSITTYYEVIKSCESIDNYKVLYYSKGEAYFRNVLTFLKMFGSDFVINKSQKLIKFRNGSKIYFRDNEESLKGMEFNVLIVSDSLNENQLNN